MTAISRAVIAKGGPEKNEGEYIYWFTYRYPRFDTRAGIL